VVSGSAFDSNLNDDELEAIKKAVRVDATVWGYFLKYCVVGFPKWGAEYYGYEELAKRPSSSGFGKPIVGLGAVLGLPTRRRAIKDDVAGRMVTACSHASQAIVRGSPEVGSLVARTCKA
jgi:hypothetical protein